MGAVTYYVETLKGRGGVGTDTVTGSRWYARERYLDLTRQGRWARVTDNTGRVLIEA